jgi:hypothetical protein
VKPATEPNGRRGASRLACLAVVASWVSACGSSSNTATSSSDASTDHAIQLTTVITMGAPFGDSGGSDGAADAPGISDSSLSPDGAPDDAAISDDSPSDSTWIGWPDSGDAAFTCGPYVAPPCNGAPCDLRTNTCCLTAQLQERCVPGHGMGTCNSNEAVIQCGTACDCPYGTVCCGSLYTLYSLVETTCQAVPPDGHCSPYPQTSTQASGQLCGQSGECVNGEGCIYQTCVLGVTLHVCGLQSQAPFNCAVVTPDN